MRPIIVNACCGQSRPEWRLPRIEDRLRPRVCRPILIDRVDQDFFHQLQIAIAH